MKLSSVILIIILVQLLYVYYVRWGLSKINDKLSLIRSK